MKLYFKSIGAGDPVVVLHGIFGSSDNWGTIGKNLSERFNVFLVDLRNHGKSFHSDNFSYQDMASDVLSFCKDQSLNNINLIGHSMGGKVAMEIATTNPSLVKTLAVIDIGPKEYPVHHEDIVEALMSIDLKKINSRKEADKHLSLFIKVLPVRQFLLKNLNRGENGYHWKLNLKAISSNINEVAKPLEKDRIYNGKTLFIKGSLSNYISDNDFPLIKNHFPNALLVQIQNAGHWVHAEKPDELIHQLDYFLT